MKCMFCGCLESKVIDSRSTDDGTIIRRRRECLKCGKRFTTYETVENTPILVIKSNGARQTFDPGKIKNGIIKEALVETLGCSGMTHSAAMAAEILTGKTILEALNSDLVCDAINTAMRELFLQIVYGRSQSAFSEGGLTIGAGLEDLGKGLRSQIGTMYATEAKGPRYLEMAEGYVLEVGLDKNNEIIGYKFVNLGKMMDAIKKGEDPKTAYEKNISKYGRYDEAVKKIDPRKE